MPSQPSSHLCSLWNNTCISGSFEQEGAALHEANCPIWGPIPQRWILTS